MKDENAGHSLLYNPLVDGTFKNTYAAEADLSKFLSRPVLIHTFNWAEGAALDTGFQPWFDFFNNVRIKKKLDNYAFLQANLHIKLMVNASPFYYGGAIMSYLPYSEYNAAFIDPSLDVTNLTIPYSQRPHIWFYPACNQGGSMILPYINKQDWIDSTSADYLLGMGSVRIISPDILRNANNVSGESVSIQVWAWAEDIVLCGPTTALALQADEYQLDGVVSAPASAIADAADALISIPTIAPYATATSFVARQTAKIAAWFGWTNPPVITEVKPFKSLPFHSLASAEISQPTEKLTLDPKNELSVDPRTIGLSGNDELIITNLAQRESFIGVSFWDGVKAPQTLLLSMRIVPNYFVEQTDLSIVKHQMVPMAWLAHLFEYWRGDIIIRFRFIASKYHKGRVLISWDPKSDISANVAEPSENFSRIVDISEEPDVEVRINYMQAQTWLKANMDNSIKNLALDGTTIGVHREGEDNGILSMRVLTKQTSPVADAPIAIFVSVRGADNMEFANPRELTNELSPYRTQSDEYVLQSEELTYGAPTGQSIAGMGTGREDCNKNLVYIGETITSLRQLLRRSTLSRVDNFFSASPNINHFIFSMNRSRYPLYYGFDPSGVDKATQIIGASTVPFNYVANHPLNWIRMCYLANRGSVRWHYNVDCPDNVSNLRSSRYIGLRTVGDFNKLIAINNASTARSFRNRTFLFDALFTGSTGQSVVNQRTQTGLSVELPMYSRYRMLTNDPLTNTGGTPDDDSNDQSNLITFATTPGADDQKGAEPINTVMYSYCSIGTDWTCLYFLNVPTLYNYGLVPETPAA